ncbi:MAG: hypothetical protein QNJ36_06365 [Calothrix sp. MO_167.B42]|nr:hypothetical protein [Calothrix sp. MO_167.B42]
MIQRSLNRKKQSLKSDRTFSNHKQMRSLLYPQTLPNVLSQKRKAIALSK